jgi:hypothetical protein
MVIVSIIIFHHDHSSAGTWTRFGTICTESGICNHGIIIRRNLDEDQVEVIIQNRRILFTRSSPVRIDTSLQGGFCASHVLLHRVDLCRREWRLAVVLNVEAIVRRRTHHGGMMCFHTQSAELLKGSINLLVCLPDCPISVGKFESDLHKANREISRIHILLRRIMPLCSADLCHLTGYNIVAGAWTAHHLQQ